MAKGFAQNPVPKPFRVPLGPKAAKGKGKKLPPSIFSQAHPKSLSKPPGVPAPSRPSGTPPKGVRIRGQYHPNAPNTHLFSDIGHVASHAADVTYHATPLPSTFDFIAHPGNQALQKKDIARQKKDFSSVAEATTGYKEIQHIRQNPLAGGIAIASLFPIGRAAKLGELGVEAVRATEAGAKAAKAAEGGSRIAEFRAARKALKAAKQLPKGAKRTPAQVDQHISQVAAEAKALGHGVKGEEIPMLNPGQITPETGGPLGLEVRHALQGPDVSGMGKFEKVGAKLDQPGVAAARKVQEAGYSVERAKRVSAARQAYESAGGGTAGHIAAKEQLKGELPKVAIQGLSHLDRPSIDALTRHIWDYPHLQDLSKVSAVDAIEKLASGGSVTQSEQKLLQKVFGVEMRPQNLKATIKQMGFKNFVFNLIGIPRSIMASTDLSLTLRQGFVALTARPKLMLRHIRTMIKSFGSEQVAMGAQKGIESLPTFPIMERGGLNVTSYLAGPASREEPYMYSQIAEHLPGVGHVIKGSDRAFVIGGNLERAHYADFMLRGAAAEGWDLHDPHLIESIAKYANTATGRGALPKIIEKHALSLNATFFAPRFMASRFNMLSPAYYIGLHPYVRREALRSMIRITHMVAASLYMAHLSGAKVVLDPRNSDFGKARWGNMRVDFTGGYGATVRFVAQLATDTAISSTSGKKEKLSNHQGTILWRFFSGKFNPPVSAIVQGVQHQDAIGQPLNFKSLNPSKNFVMQRFTPMIIQDMIDVTNDDPKKLPAILPDIFGASVQDYPPSKKKSSGGSGSGWGGSGGGWGGSSSSSGW